MQEETRHQVALTRYKLISPVLAEPGRVQNEYFRKKAETLHILPHYGPRKVSVSTFKRWLALYRQGGFDALKPKQRADQGRPRRLSDEGRAAIEGKCKAFPHWTVKMIFESLLADEQLGDPPTSYNTVLRVIRKNKLLPERGRTDARKRYEVDNTLDLWVADFLHGPLVLVGKRHRKAILCAIIDDHSRMIVGASFSAYETVTALTKVFKDAMLAYGLPRRFYADNGPAFCADLLASACAHASIALIHSKPYDPPSRGKIERFFRTVRDRFLAAHQGEMTLEELNEAFTKWLRDDYHHKYHSGIHQKPIERYNASAARIDVRRLSRTELDQLFLVEHQRVVTNDATISFQGGVYEVPAAYIRQRVEVRHPVDDASELYLYDGGARIAKLKLVDKHENARTFRPQKTAVPVSFADGEVRR